MSVVEIFSQGPNETLAVGRRLAALLRPGDIVLLAGRLGSGKTLLAGGIAEGLGIDVPVTSPTFVLVNVYEGFLPLVHADVYRLGSFAEFEDLDLPREAAEGVLLVEWGDVIESQVPSDHLMIRLDMIDEETRRLTFLPMGSWAARPLEELQE